MTQKDAFRKRLVVRTNSSGLSCTLTILPGGQDDLPSELEIAGVLETYHIAPARTDNDAIAELCRLAKNDQDAEHSAIVATGIPAEDGIHAAFTLDPSLAAEFEAIAKRRERFEAEAHEPGTSCCGDEPDTNVDYRSQSAFVIVRRGDVLGHITEKTEGVDGMNVRGEVIPAKGGRSLTIERNESTRIEGDNLVAAVDGRLIYNLVRIRVERRLEVSGDVDFTTGNIEFPGDVLIRGGIKDMFRVRNSGSLRVERLIEAGTLDVKGDATLLRGMAGRGGGMLTIGRDLHAHYLDGVKGTITRDCIVTNEIKECTLRVGGSVRSPACSFYGGVLKTIRPVELGTVGSAGGAETVLEIGQLPDLGDLVDRLGSLFGAIDSERDRSADELQALNDTIKKLTPTQAERLTELQFTQIRTEEYTEMVAKAAGTLLDSVRSFPTPRLSVSRSLHRGVRLRLRHLEFVTREAVSCPMILELGPTGKPRCFLNGATQPAPVEKFLVPTSACGGNPLATLTAYVNRILDRANDAA